MNINPQKYALKRMYELRTCPPLEILQQGGAQVEAHLKKCLSCQKRKSEAEFIFDLKAKINIPPKIAKPKPPYAGQICQVLCPADERLAADGFWHNPPLVLLLPNTRHPQSRINVAQIHDASELAAQGDVPLTDIFSDYYVETWNTWSVFAEHLTVIGRIDCSTLTLVLKELRSFGHLGTNLPNIGLLQKIFRDQERTNSAFFQSLEEQFAQRKSSEPRINDKKIFFADFKSQQLWLKATRCYTAKADQITVSDTDFGSQHLSAWATLVGPNQNDSLIPMQFDLEQNADQLFVRAKTNLTITQVAAITAINAWMDNSDNHALTIETDFDPDKNLLTLLMSFAHKKMEESTPTPKHHRAFNFAACGVAAFASIPFIGAAGMLFGGGSRKKKFIDGAENIENLYDNEDQNQYKNQFPAVLISLENIPKE